MAATYTIMRILPRVCKKKGVGKGITTNLLNKVRVVLLVAQLKHGDVVNTRMPVGHTPTPPRCLFIAPAVFNKIRPVQYVFIVKKCSSTQ
jgi:hypothetical protein